MAKTHLVYCNALAVVIIVTVALGASAVPKMDAKRLAHRDKFNQMKPYIVEMLQLGSHGELFYPGCFGTGSNDGVVWAVKRADGSGSELLVEWDWEFIKYADISEEGVITYCETPKTRGLTCGTFCGPTKWLQDKLSTRLMGNKMIGLVDYKNYVERLPERPAHCVAAVYGLSDGGFMACPFEAPLSPFPLWLIRVDAAHLRIVTSKPPEQVVGDIRIEKGKVLSSLKRDAKMRVLDPPAVGECAMNCDDSAIIVPKGAFYLSSIGGTRLLMSD